MTGLDGSAYLGALVALAAVLLMIVGLGRLAGRVRLPTQLAQRLGAARPDEPVTVRAGARIDSRRRVVVIRWNGRDGLVLLGPHGDVLLGWASEPGAAP